MSKSETYIVEVEMDEYNFFREITQEQLDRIMATDDGEVAREIIVDEGNDESISNTGQVDLYFSYPEDWKEVKLDWIEYLA